MTVEAPEEEEKDVYLPEPAEVRQVERMTELEKYFEFRPLDGSPLGHRPGQFLQISIPGIGECPISISSSPTRSEDGFEMVVREMGNVTSAMHELEPGDQVGIRGPYGTEFPVDDAMKGRDLLFITGGIGLVPMRSAIHYVLDNRDDYGNITILYGTTEPSMRLFTDELAEWRERDDIEFHETVDEADEDWDGNEGVITTLMPELDIDTQDTMVGVCGPPVMYKFVMLELIEMDMPHENIYLSLERNMKCGVGKCGHCQINGVYVCQDGPVFCYEEVEGLEEAIR